MSPPQPAQELLKVAYSGTGTGLKTAAAIALLTPQVRVADEKLQPHLSLLFLSPLKPNRAAERFPSHVGRWMLATARNRGAVRLHYWPRLLAQNRWPSTRKPDWLRLERAQSLHRSQDWARRPLPTGVGVRPAVSRRVRQRVPVLPCCSARRHFRARLPLSPEPDVEQNLHVPEPRHQRHDRLHLFVGLCAHRLRFGRHVRRRLREVLFDAVAVPRLPLPVGH